jgi:hypothetical protein
MTTSDLQFDTVMTAVKAAKVRNAENTMSIINNEKVQLINREFTLNHECTIKESFQKLTAHGYEYEATELERVLTVINSI